MDPEHTPQVLMGVGEAAGSTIEPASAGRERGDAAISKHGVEKSTVAMPRMGGVGASEGRRLVRGVVWWLIGVLVGEMVVL